MSAKHSQIVVSLDGNIGAGKSTLLAKLRSLSGVHIIDEPVDTWEKFRTQDGTNLLQYFYSDTKRWAYTFQNAAILTRMCHIRKTLEEHPECSIFITERSTLTDKYVFAKMLHDDGMLNDMEMELYNAWFDNFASNIPIKHILWLDTDVLTSFERIRRRGRVGEENINTEYLEKLDRAHHNWLNSPEMVSKCTRIYSDITVEEIESILETVVGTINLDDLNSKNSIEENMCGIQ